MARQHFVAEIKPLTTKSGGALSLSGHPGGHPHPGRGIGLRRSLSGRHGLIKACHGFTLGLQHRRPVENPLEIGEHPRCAAFLDTLKKNHVPPIFILGGTLGDSWPDVLP